MRWWDRPLTGYGKDHGREGESKDRTEAGQEGHGAVKIILTTIVRTTSARLPDTFVPHALFHIPLGFYTLTATRAGLGAAGIFVLRVGVSVSLAVLLVLTTRWADILKSLRFFRVPTIFVLILGMTYRYIFLLLHTVNGMFEARKSRIVARTSGKEQRWWIVSSMSVLMSRSFRMSDEVYQAMLARGFTGQIRTLTDYRMTLPDWALGFGAVAVSIAAISVNSWLL